MGNMGYCRFQNTLQDLIDCSDNMDENGDLSPEEKRAREKLIDLCAEIAADYAEVDNDDNDDNDECM